MDCYLVDINGSKKPLEGTEFETLTFDQQMEPHVCQFWEKWEILN